MLQWGGGGAGWRSCVLRILSGSETQTHLGEKGKVHLRWGLLERHNDVAHLHVLPEVLL